MPNKMNITFSKAMVSIENFSRELTVLCDACDRFDRAGIEYMVAGPFATNYYLGHSMSSDFELVVNLSSENASHIRAMFEPDYSLSQEEVECALLTQDVFYLLHVGSVVKMKIIIKRDELYRQVAFDGRNTANVAGFNLWIINKEDLVLFKLEAAKKSRCQVELGEVSALLASGADQGHLKRWASHLRVEDLLADLLAAPNNRTNFNKAA